MNSTSVPLGAQPASTTPTGAARVVAPPPSLQRFEARRGEGPGNWVDYDRHPAYRPLIEGASIGTRLSSLIGFAKYFGIIVCKRLISYELIPTHLRKPNTPTGVLRLLKAAAGNALRRLVPRNSPSDTANPVHASLAADGICVLQLAPHDAGSIGAASQPLFDGLRQRRGSKADGGREFDESRSYARRTTHGELFAAVERVLTTSGVLAGVSDYVGRPVALVDVNPQINDKSDDFWRRIFPDLPAADRPVAYMHRDASGGDIKAIFYMSDVGPDSGAFAYATGTHRLQQSTLIDWFEETNDQSAWSGTGPVNRARFAALPRALRRKCSMGNDLLPDGEAAKRLLAAEWTVTAPSGHLVIFDTKGCHRGGMVREDERRVITCVLG